MTQNSTGGVYSIPDPLAKFLGKGGRYEWVQLNVPPDKLQVISETVTKAITCTGDDNKNWQ